MLRIPGARPVKMSQKPPINSTPGSNKPPKANWNDRFVLDTIPEYSAIHDRNINQQKLNTRMKSRQGGSRARLEVGGRIRPSTRSKVGGTGDNLSVRSGSTDGSPMRQGYAIQNQHQQNSFAQHSQVSSSGHGGVGYVSSNRGSHGPTSQSAQGYPTNKKPRAQSNMRRKRQTQVNEETLQKLKEELYQLWDTYQIDNYHRNVFDEVTQGLSPEILSPIIAMEIQDFQLDKAPILKLTKAVIAREECLKQTLNFNDSLASVSSVTQNMLNQAVELIHSMRMLSIHTVEMIQVWRDQMMYSYKLSNVENPGMMPQIPYIFKNVNYLIKIKDDTSFFRKSEFANFFNFAKNADPFFVVTASQHVAAGGGIKGLKKKGQQSLPSTQASGGLDKKLTVPLQNAIMKRVRVCENILMEEAVQQELNKYSGNPDKAVLRDSNNETNLEPLIEETQIMTTEDDNSSPLKQPLKQTQHPGVISPPQPTRATQPPQPPETEEADDDDHEVTKDDIKEEELILKPFTYYLNKGMTFDQLFEGYFEQLDEKQQKPLSKLKQVKERIDKGYFPHYYTLSHESTWAILGIIVFNYDHSYQIRKRINILHLSALNPEHLPQLIKLSLHQIFTLTNAEEVRVDLHQPKGEEKVDVELKDAYKKNAFRWKQYINEMETGDKKEVMGANRTVGVEPNLNAIDLSINPLVATAGVLLRVGTKDSQSRPTTGVEDGKVLNKTCLLQAIMEYKSKHISPDESISEHTNLSEDANYLNGVLRAIEQGKCQLPEAIHRTTISEQCSEAQKILESQGIPIEGLKFGEKETKDTFISSVMSVECKWTSFSFHKMNFQGAETNFIGLGHENFNVATSGDFKLIFWPTDDPSMNMFVVMGNVEHVKASSMFQFSQELLTNAQTSDEKIECLYMPGFTKSVNQRPLNYMSGYILDNDKCITKAYESLKFNVWSCSPYDDYIAPELKEKGIMLDKPFLIGITHEKLSEQLEFPLIISKVGK